MDELKIYFKSQGKNADQLLNEITDNFKINVYVLLAIASKIFEKLNLLNHQFQGLYTTIIIYRDCIKTFMDKLKLYISKIENRNISCFPRLAQIIDNSNISENINNEIVAHLKYLYSEFESYFPEINTVIFLV